ncbi:hypothetical protein ZYGR_0H01470 [Zygosaccharomyces rouxii]|uniref:ZYRO0B07414p n=2 Tax=Zygosaccharomyces rouxii TaxID=4956 RepID=C5DRC7_ZYGRC|nr:uncharacterized protein ZYRO0B07414g [Zygosaccharomyces rouxii]KAH9200120.1 fatty acid desaturase-domain-containing protein [Zygosaccharomyces rouxii]GAV47306.1 hypothetical protein ZYGR_0H01470 [Zygosaccharomyces rouxii]CAR26338.1 ZYRO0B07414p [Zygosaccharomyces rouxii]
MTVNRTTGVSATQTTEDKYAVDTYGHVFKVPNFTIKDILKVIPAECYERSLLRGLGYIARDIACLASIGYAAHKVLYPMLFDSASDQWYMQLAKFSFWLTYTYIQGLFCTGLWVLAHECGHQAFSDYGTVNDFVGWCLHSYLLVPYFSWKYSHSKHHKATNHMTRDMVFVPPDAAKFKEQRGIIGELAHHSEDSPLRTLYELILQQAGGWWTYLLVNVTGQEYPGVAKWKWNHFYPFTPLFERRDALYVFLSDVGIFTMGLILKIWYDKFGGWSLFINWFVPYLWCNHWLVFITYLQHTDPTLPHYDSEEWTFAKGAAATVDRQFGFVGKHIFHDIIETHVSHHFCSRIPFYRAREATEHIRSVMGDSYRSSDENMWVSLWKSARACQWVEGSNGVLMFRNVNEVGVGADDKKKL